METMNRKLGVPDLRPVGFSVGNSVSVSDTDKWTTRKNEKNEMD